MRNLDHVREHGKTGGPRRGHSIAGGADRASDFRGKLSGCDPLCVRQDTPSRSPARTRTAERERRRPNRTEEFSGFERISANMARKTQSGDASDVQGG